MISMIFVGDCIDRMNNDNDETGRVAVIQALAWRWRAVPQVLASVSCG